MIALNPNRVFTFTSPRELRRLYLLGIHGPEGVCILEIGSHLGASSLYLAEAAKELDGKLYCVDTWMNDAMGEGVKDTWEEFCNNTKSLSTRIVPIRARSTEFDYSMIDGPVDFIFIDGDHSYEGVSRDFEYVKPLLAERPVIAFHDSMQKGVSRFLGELLQSGDWVIRGIDGSVSWFERSGSRTGRSNVNAS